MSELKEYLCVEAFIPYTKEIPGYLFKCAKYRAPQAEMELVYLKSEADRYIGELKEQIEAANTQIENFINNASRIMLMQDKVNDNKCDELRHQKYKRCLAVARRCHNESLWWYSKGYGFEKYDKFWEKWEKRWLELAEKFKEAK